VTAGGQQVRWDVAVADGEAAREALDGFYHLGAGGCPG
jgi:hypothetical protein